MAHQKNSVNDNYWPDVMIINGYSIFMGYLLMCVRGLGFLVLTWTTVVLLGGFVSMLQKKDFWCLTAITLVQTSGVFDFLLKEKASDIGSFLFGLLYAVAATFGRPLTKDTNTPTTPKPSIGRLLLALVSLVFQVLALALVLCPLAILYVFGVYFSAGIALWRLIQNDYGNIDGGANFKPALNVLYSLAVAQGVVYGYRAIFDLKARAIIVELVADGYSLEAVLVSEYLDETMTGCMKDPLFARGRNLITYAVDLLVESKSRSGYISGVMILGKVIHKAARPHEREQPGLIKQLLTGSACFSHVVQRLAETFGPTSAYNTETEIRVRASRIVANVAGSIRLDQFSDQGMMMIECISSLLDTFREDSRRHEGQWHEVPKEYERDWLRDEEKQWELYCKKVDVIPTATAAVNNTQESGNGYPLQGYKGLVVQGLRILQKLAANENNCRVMSNTEGLLSKAMAPLISDKLHGDDHDEWSIIAVESLEFMNQLMATLGQTETTKLTSEISSISQAIMRTLGCNKCKLLMKRQAAELHLHLSPDTLPSIVPGASGSRSNIILVWLMLEIFLLPDYHFVPRMRGATHLLKISSYTKRLAGEKMLAMVSSKTEESGMLPSVVADVIASLARTVAGAENHAYIIHAAMILEHLCEHYTKDDENLQELKKVVANVTKEVLNEIVQWLKKKVQDVTEADNGGKVLLAEGPDLEQDAVPLLHDDNGQEGSSTAHQKKGEQHQGIIEPQEALLKLCLAIDKKWIDKDQDLARHFNMIAAEICSGQGVLDSTFRELVRELDSGVQYILEDSKLSEEEKRTRRLAAKALGFILGVRTS